MDRNGPLLVADGASPRMGHDVPSSRVRIVSSPAQMLRTPRAACVTTEAIRLQFPRYGYVSTILF